MPGVKLFLAAIALAATSTAAADVVEPTPGAQWITAAGQIGALGILSWAVWFLLTRTVPQLQDTFRATISEINMEQKMTLDRVTARHDQWEQIRHADAEKLDATLRAMTEQCARAQSHLPAKE